MQHPAVPGHKWQGGEDQEQVGGVGVHVGVVATHGRGGSGGSGGGFNPERERRGGGRVNRGE